MQSYVRNVINYTYIGQTERSIAERLAGHRSDIKYNNKYIETAEHFNLPNHSANDITVTILDNNASWTKDQRLAKEDCLY